MAIDFPSSPTVGQSYTFGGVNYVFTAQGVWATSNSTLGFQVGIQRFIASGTYTPMAGLSYAIIECVGAGGAGGGASSLSGSTSFQGGGGGGGGYSRKLVTAAQIGASQTVTIGAGGTGVVGGNGNPGAATSVGSLCIANGGGAGAFSASGVNPSGAAGGVAGTGDVAVAGAWGGWGWTGNNQTPDRGFSGNGATGPFGGGSSTPVTGGPVTGVNATGYGAGGAGGNSYAATGTVAGGAGSPGIVIITEYAGSPTGASGGNVISSGVPLNGQIAQWTSANTIQGTNAPGLLTLITTQTVSTPVASVDFTTGINNTYDEYQVHVLNWVNAVSDAPGFRLSTDSGSTWLSAASYQRGGYIGFANNTLAASGSAAATYFGLSGNGPAGITGGLVPLSSVIKFFLPATSNVWKGFLVSTVYHDAAQGIGHFGQGGAYTGTVNAINGIRFMNGAGNTIGGGTFNLYGVRK